MFSILYKFDKFIESAPCKSVLVAKYTKYLQSQLWLDIRNGDYQTKPLLICSTMQEGISYAILQHPGLYTNLSEGDEGLTLMGARDIIVQSESSQEMFQMKRPENQKISYTDFPCCTSTKIQTVHIKRRALDCSPFLLSQLHQYSYKDSIRSGSTLPVNCCKSTFICTL